MPQTIGADISVWIQRLEAHPPAVRRASPDLLAQLRQTLRRPVDRVLCIATDIDPAVDLLSGVMRDHPDDVVNGLRLLRELVSVDPLLIDARQARKFDSAYPNLDPSLLIRRFFGRRLRYGTLPTEVGVLVVDALTLAWLGRLIEGKPALPLPVVIDDRRDKQRRRVTADPTSRVADVLASAVALTDDVVLHQGSALQQRGVELDAPIGKTELWFHVDARRPVINPLPCTRCGECVIACPVQLQPAALLEAAQRRDAGAGERFHIKSCIECGLCSVACPSQLPVLASIRELKRLPT